MRPVGRFLAPKIADATKETMDFLECVMEFSCRHQKWRVKWKEHDGDMRQKLGHFHPPTPVDQKSNVTLGKNICCNVRKIVGVFGFGLGGRRPPDFREVLVSILFRVASAGAEKVRRLYV